MTRLDDSYSSWPLPSGSKHIRLFDIQPTPPNVPDQYAHPIQGELRVVDLEEQPSFTALSYVWGTYAGVPHIITCGEHNIQLKVTANCHSALLHLRAKLGGFSIWVDAVCINQHDKGEKSNQIPLIGNIYSAAETVYIWLGEGNIRTGRAMAYLATAGFLEYFDSTPLDKGQSTSRPWAAAFRAFLSTYSLKKHPFPFREPANFFDQFYFHTNLRFSSQYVMGPDLEDLLGREWVRRLWTYQEVLLASNPVLVCGNDHLTWSRFELSINFLAQCSSDFLGHVIQPWKRVTTSRIRMFSEISQPLESSNHLKLLEYVAFAQKLSRNLRIIIVVWVSGLLLISTPLFFLILQIFEPIHIVLVYAVFLFNTLVACSMAFFLSYSGRWAPPMDNSETPQMNDLIRELYSRRATDPKDMAFGLWAVVKRQAGVELSIPGYSDSLGDIYRIFTAHLLGVTKSLHILHLAATKSVPGQPSWIPDWAAGSSRNSAILASGDWCSHWKENLKAQELWNEDVSSPNFYKLTDDFCCLTVRARGVATIGECYRFRETRQEYHYTDQALHVNNMHSALDLNLMYAGEFYDAMQTLLDTSSPGGDDDRDRERFLYENPESSAMDWVSPGGVRDRKFRDWKIFLHRNRESSASKALSLLRSRGTMQYSLYNRPLGKGSFRYVPYRDIFRTHLAICRDFARSGITFFRWSDRKIGKTWGRCSRNVRPGDKVVLIEGVPVPLIVRPCGASPKAVKILGHTQFTKKFDWWEVTPRYDSVFTKTSEELDIY